MITRGKRQFGRLRPGYEIDPTDAYKKGLIMTVPTAGSGDVVDVLLAQHEQIKQALVDVGDATGADRANAFASLKTLLELHEKGEQKVVHPVTRDVGHSSEIASNRLQEENHAAAALAELAGLGVDHPEFDERFDEFRRDVLNHAEHEEQEEFPRLRSVVTAGQLNAMAGELRSVQAMP